MNLYFIFLVLISLLGIQIFVGKKGFNKDYLSKTSTSAVKGFFILLVFYSHCLAYTHPIMSKDFLMYDLRMFVGQLMVTLFLFYSGYGIYESIKNKKDYVKTIPKNRVLKTWLYFVVAVLLYLILFLVIGKEKLTVDRLLFSFIGWKNLGNSAWYIFTILCLYISTFVSFKIFNKRNERKKALILNYIFAIILAVFLSFYKEPCYYNTLLCYCFGMSYSFHKKEIEKKLLNWKNYLIITGITILAFIAFRNYRNDSFWYYEIYSMIFCLLVIEATLVINVRSKVLKWFGDNLFWVYILQRIPMIILVDLGFAAHPYRLFSISFVATIILVLIFSTISKYTDKLFLKKWIKNE